jgi:hypothetical protein
VRTSLLQQEIERQRRETIRGIRYDIESLYWRDTNMNVQVLGSTAQAVVLDYTDDKSTVYAVVPNDQTLHYYNPNGTVMANQGARAWYLHRDTEIITNSEGDPVRPLECYYDGNHVWHVRNRFLSYRAASFNEVFYTNGPFIHLIADDRIVNIPKFTTFESLPDLTGYPSNIYANTMALVSTRHYVAKFHQSQFVAWALIVLDNPPVLDSADIIDVPAGIHPIKTRKRYWYNGLTYDTRAFNV